VNDRAGVTRDIVVPVNAPRTDKEINFQVPDEPANVPAGVYRMSVLVMPTGKAEETRESNEMALLVAPKITSDLTIPVARANVDPNTKLGEADITLTVKPEVREKQRISLVLGTREFPVTQPVAAGASVSFHATQLAAGKYRVRLRVDGVDSLLIDRSDPKNMEFGEPKNLKFDDSQQLTIT
jgi:hypothetical protein